MVMQEALVSALRDTVKKLQEDPEADAFLLPVDTTKYMDYLTIVKQPMDLSAISQKLADNPPKYTRFSEFWHDVGLVWANCQLYNRKGSVICKVAQSMQRKADEMRRRIEADGVLGPLTVLPDQLQPDAPQEETKKPADAVVVESLASGSAASDAANSAAAKAAAAKAAAAAAAASAAGGGVVAPVSKSGSKKKGKVAKQHQQHQQQQQVGGGRGGGSPHQSSGLDNEVDALRAEIERLQAKAAEKSGQRMSGHGGDNNPPVTPPPDVSYSHGSYSGPSSALPVHYGAGYPWGGYYPNPYSMTQHQLLMLRMSTNVPSMCCACHLLMDRPNGRVVSCLHTCRQTYLFCLFRHQ
mmetsp:Transcript_15163/g.43447  ORF Transcript_15163/g.43447 Transcript_15163/m.43447 type:complete len:353 (+) Transcript_15163:143-1201(+)